MSVRASVYFSAITAYLIAVVQFASAVVTARLMSPTEIGIFAIGLSIVLLATLVADFGADIFMVQRQGLGESDLRAGTFVAWVGALAVGGLLAGCGQLIAGAYQQPEIRTDLLILSLRIFLYPVGVASGAILAKEMRYMQMSVMKLSTALVQSGVSITLVVLGYSHTGLAIGYICGFAAELACKACFCPRSFFIRPAAKGALEVVRFGLRSAPVSVLGTVALSAPSLIIGYFLGAGDSGRYARAMSLVAIVNRGIGGVISQVGIPAFSQAKAENADMRAVFLSSTTLLTGISWPLFAMIIVLSDPIILFLFGKAWIEISPIAQLLCAGNMLSVMSVLSGSLLLGVGCVGTLLRRELLAQGIVIGLILLGAQFSLPTVAGLLVVSSLLQILVTYQLLNSTIGLSFTSVICDNGKSAAVVLATAFGCWLASLCTGDLTPLARILVGGAAGLAAWAAALVLTRHTLLRELNRLRTALAQRRRG